MLTFAVEHSTSSAGVAHFHDGEPAGVRRWTADRATPNRIWDEIRGVLSDCSIRPEKIDCYAAGLGPGAYSGLRVSLMALRGMALADMKPVIGVSSGEAIAAAAFRSMQVDSAVVAGDARRGRLWAAVFRRSAPWPERVRDYALIQPSELPAFAPDGAALLSPDMERIAPLLSAADTGRLIVSGAAAIPDVSDIARLAIERFRAGMAPGPGEALRPIYLHPPVFVEPLHSQSGA
jgi:tRNA threonylcarbamoyladenosine biosynthesis protein TsaB